MDGLSNISYNEDLVFSLIQDRFSHFTGKHNPKQSQDTNSLYPYLRWNRLVPFLFYKIKKEKKEDFFDPAFIQTLTSFNKKEVLRSMKREAVLKKTLSLLSENKIDVILLKGALFAYTYYPSPELRPSYDIDLLINPEDITKAREILLNAGFEKWYELESADTMGQMPHIPGLKYLGIPVELHHHLFHGYESQPVSIQEIFSGTKKISLFGYEINILSPEINLYYLLYHIRKHINDGYTRLIWLLDIKLILEKETHANIKSALKKWLSQYHKKNEMEEVICFAEYVTGIKFYNSSWNDGIIKEFLLKCHDHRGTEYIKTINALKKLPNAKYKIKYILGRLLPSFTYVKYKYGVKHNIKVPFYYLRIYFEYLVKLIRVMFVK